MDLLNQVLNRSDLLDLRICGSAAVTSSIIYRLKVETLFLFEKVATERKGVQSEPLPQILNMPFRFELHSTSAKELVGVLEDLLQETLSRIKDEKLIDPIIDPEVDFEIDDYEKRVTEMLNSFRIELSKILEEKDTISFLNYFEEKSLEDKVHSFILLLFIAMEGLIDLKQDGDDILVEGAGKEFV